MECSQGNLYISDRLRTFIPCSATYILEVGAQVWLKVAKKDL